MNYDLDKIIVLDDVVPQWLHDQAISQVLNTPVSYGHRGLGPDQGHPIFSQQYTHEQVHKAPWTLKAVWHAFEHQVRYQKIPCLFTSFFVQSYRTNILNYLNLR